MKWPSGPSVINKWMEIRTFISYGIFLLIKTNDGVVTRLTMSWARGFKPYTGPVPMLRAFHIPQQDYLM